MHCQGTEQLDAILQFLCITSVPALLVLLQQSMPELGEADLRRHSQAEKASVSRARMPFFCMLLYLIIVHVCLSCSVPGLASNQNSVGQQALGYSRHTAVPQKHQLLQFLQEAEASVLLNVITA